jgi:hypothetical protein
MANVGRGRGRGGRGEGRGNTDDSEPLLSRGVVWTDSLIEILLSMYEEKYIGQNYNPIGKSQWQTMLHVFNARGKVQFNRDNLISKIDSLKRKWKAEKKGKSTTGGTPSIWIWFDTCDRIWGRTPKTQGIQGAIDVGDSQEDVDAEHVGGPSEPTGLDLNQPIEVDAYTTPPRKSPRRRINIDKTPPKTLTPRTRATISPNVSGRKAAQKRKGTDYDAEDNVLKGMEGFAQALLKIEETRSQMLLKIESDRADRELTMMKWKEEVEDRRAKEKEEAEDRRAKEKRESDERIAAQNLAFQLEIQKLKAQLKSGPGGSST